MSADQDAARGREEEGVSSGREMAETATAAVEGAKEDTEVKEEVVLVEEEEEDDTPVDLSAFWIKPDQVSSSFAGQFVSLLQISRTHIRKHYPQYNIMEQNKMHTKNCISGLWIFIQEFNH